MEEITTSRQSMIMDRTRLSQRKEREEIMEWLAKRDIIVLDMWNDYVIQSVSGARGGCCEVALGARVCLVGLQWAACPVVNVTGLLRAAWPASKGVQGSAQVRLVAREQRRKREGCGRPVVRELAVACLGSGTLMLAYDE
ncbi:unnamed protein product [Dovyalis caffra]|uniref:Uncharacterized protein n=1 Tax=Dovyalis caffra TaxID=77055 RepID=A0AAV1SSP8_9ROSI|nr:unnamed protein product [Dovyalis caffra]